MILLFGRIGSNRAKKKIKIVCPEIKSINLTYVRYVYEDSWLLIVFIVSLFLVLFDAVVIIVIIIIIIIVVIVVNHIMSQTWVSRICA